LSEVPVRIIEADDKLTAELALVENLQREDLNPIEEARGYRLLMEEYGMTQEETAKSVGRSRPAVTNSLRLLSLSPKVLELVEQGKLSAGQARALVPMTDDALQLGAALHIIAKNYSVRKTEQYVASLMKAKPEGKTPPAIDYAADVSDRLSKALGRKVKLVDGKRSGRIELEFYGSDDREKLISLLARLGK